MKAVLWTIGIVIIIGVIWYYYFKRKDIIVTGPITGGLLLGDQQQGNQGNPQITLPSDLINPLL